LHVSSLDIKPWSKPMYRKFLTNLTMKQNTKTRGFVSLFSYLLSSSSREGVFFLCNSSTFVNMTDELKKKIYLAFLGYFIMIRLRKSTTIGQYLIASFQKFVARITTQMTNQRSKSSRLHSISCEACRII
jgi:hypothetical protein